jgi:hypothetical protein
MTGNPVKQFEAYPTRAAVDAWYQRLTTSAYQVDVNDVLYQYDASSDYNPSPDLEKIKAKLLAIEFEDDQINSPEFAALDREIPRVKNGRYVIIPTVKQSNGEAGNIANGELWGGSFAEPSRLACSLVGGSWWPRCLNGGFLVTGWPAVKAAPTGASPSAPTKDGLNKRCSLVTQ